jgi:hypothetical protein
MSAFLISANSPSDIFAIVTHRVLKLCSDMIRLGIGTCVKGLIWGSIFITKRRVCLPCL